MYCSLDYCEHNRDKWIMVKSLIHYRDVLEQIGLGTKKKDRLRQKKSMAGDIDACILKCPSPNINIRECRKVDHSCKIILGCNG